MASEQHIDVRSYTLRSVCEYIKEIFFFLVFKCGSILAHGFIIDFHTKALQSDACDFDDDGLKCSFKKLPLTTKNDFLYFFCLLLIFASLSICYCFFLSICGSQYGFICVLQTFFFFEV